MNYKFGSNPFKLREKHLMMGNLLEAPVKPPPPAWDYDAAYKHTFQMQMLGNDQVGDCVAVAIFNQILRQHWTQFRVELPITTDQVEAFYFGLTGGNDTGLDPGQAFDAWQQGITIGDFISKIDAYGIIDPTNIARLKWSNCLLTGNFFAIDIYTSMMDDFQAGKPWDRVGGSIEGGHGVYNVAYNADGTYTIITWGQRWTITQGCLNAVCQAALGAVVAQDPLAKFHVNETALETYLNNLKSS